MPHYDTHHFRESGAQDGLYQGCPFLREYRDLSALAWLIERSLAERTDFVANGDQRLMLHSRKTTQALLEQDTLDYHEDFSKRFGGVAIHCALLRR